MRKPVLCLAALLAMFGCARRAELSGTVSYDGKKVVLGSVQVVGSDGIPRPGEIKSDGTYQITDIPAGEVKIAVHSPNPTQIKVLARKRDEDVSQPKVDPRWFAIPDKASDFSTSGLTANLHAGRNTHDIELKE